MISRGTKLIVSAATICLAWGASYLAIRIGLATMPPMTMGFIRYFIAGVLLWIWSEVRGDARPTARQWASSAVLGMCFVVIGNGSVLWAEQTVPSGVAALIVAAGPSWTMLI